MLYGVDPVPVSELPARCVCGAVLTYADPVVFVTRVGGPLGSEGEDVIVCEPLQVEDSTG